MLSLFVIVFFYILFVFYLLYLYTLFIYLFFVLKYIFNFSEFIALVESIEGPSFVKSKNGFIRRLKVILTNNNWRVQLTVWEDDIDNVLFHFNTSFVSLKK